MSPSESPCLNLSVARLVAAGADHFAIWVVKAPYPGGYVHHDCTWPETLTQTWLSWQQMFSPQGAEPSVISDFSSQTTSSTSYSSRLMQQLGIQLWQWLFDGSIQRSLEHSQGIATGQEQALRLRLEIRDPDLIMLPWEIMQPQAGTQAISLGHQKLLFSRTSSDVDPLPSLRTDHCLNILLILGQNEPNSHQNVNSLQLEQEATTLRKLLENSGQITPSGGSGTFVPCQVDTLIQPTPSELISQLESGSYNILFYAGHGVSAPDGGLLFLRPGVTLNGTELAQVLTRCRVTLAVFNACWGAQPVRQGQTSIPRSSLAEVLIHHGVPAVLAMRDAIADQEALSFIEAFARSLAERMPIDQAVGVARQKLLTLYRFNQPTWTLPVLYLHPEFDGQLIQPLDGITEIPNSPTWMGQVRPTAYLRRVGATTKIWRIYGGLMRVGRSQKNDLVISEPWVSQRHAKIFCRDERIEDRVTPTYFLSDDSRFGTLVLETVGGWQQVHHQEVQLKSGMQIKFGSSQGQTWEFIIDV
jgi:CHAT domain/FHA domain